MKSKTDTKYSGMQWVYRKGRSKDQNILCHLVYKDICMQFKGVSGKYTKLKVRSK